LVAFGFLWCERSKFFYYLSVLSLDKLINAYFKLAYANPRPYMLKSDIKPISCSKGFGNPSGHSSASSLIAIVLFLDYFHGTPLKFTKYGTP
jgi:membrane-associated phospholipid phosphatase